MKNKYITDAQKFKKEVINVFTETEFDCSPETENSTEETFLASHG